MSQSPVPPTPPAPPATTQAPASPPPAPKKENIKETIESILVAFILAFVFRAFVVEAFVIPSGSMAPTLMGAHMRMRCQECGYDFQVNFPNSGPNNETLNIPSTSGPTAVKVRERGPDGRERDVTKMVDVEFSMHCLNCGFKVPRVGVPAEQSAANTPVQYGDRILVLKYLYLVQRPERWDVVVFKSPSEGSKDYTMNYIKRLVGLPGERVMLLDGDVYVDRGKDEWQVQTKPRTIQEALWRVAYDNDFLPRGANGRRWTNPWQPRGDASGWVVDGRVIRFDKATGGGELAFNPDANAGAFPFTDWLSYNETRNTEPADGRPHFQTEPYGEGWVMRWNVSDLKLRFAYARKSGDGPLRATMTKLGHGFTAELAGDKVRLVHTHGQTSRTIGEAPLKGTGPWLVELTNVDYQVRLRIDDTEVLATSPEDYRPDVADLFRRHEARERLMGRSHTLEGHDEMRAQFPPPTVSIVAERQQCELSHVGLWRDVYYTPHHQATRGRGLGTHVHAGPHNPIELSRSGRSGGDPHLAKYTENEYFVLGDNSILSGDARGWATDVNLIRHEGLYTQSGAVPERFMLGKAFFVYWPAGFRPFSGAPGVVPNFGQMRFIH